VCLVWVCLDVCSSPREEEDETCVTVLWRDSSVDAHVCVSVIDAPVDVPVCVCVTVSVIVTV
jgi:hypothetical protein